MEVQEAEGVFEAAEGPEAAEAAETLVVNLNTAPGNPSPVPSRPQSLWRWSKPQKQILESLWIENFKTATPERRRAPPTADEIAEWNARLQELDKRAIPVDQPIRWFNWALQETDPNRRHDLKREQKDYITSQLIAGTVSVLSPLERFRELQDELEGVLAVCHRPSEKVVRDWVAKLAAEAALSQSVAAAAEGAGGDGAAPTLEAQLGAFRERFATAAADVEAQLASLGADGAEPYLDPRVFAERRELLTLLKAQAAHLQRKGVGDAEMKEATGQISSLLSRLQKAAHPPDPNAPPSAKRSRRKAAEQPSDNRTMSRFLSNSMISLRRKLARVASWGQCDVALFVRFNSRRAGTAFGLSGSDHLSTEESLHLADILKDFFESVHSRRQADAAAGIHHPQVMPPTQAEIEAAAREEAAEDADEAADFGAEQEIEMEPQPGPA